MWKDTQAPKERKTLRQCTWKLDNKFNITFIEIDKGNGKKEKMMKADAESERMIRELMSRPDQQRFEWVEKHLSKFVQTAS